MAEDDLTSEEREWMESVPREVEPPQGLRGAVADRLRNVGVLRSGESRTVPIGRTTLRLVASLAFAFVVGGGLGWWGGARRAEHAAERPTVVDGRSRFVLLLYEGPEYRSLGASPAEIVQEYTTWARRLDDSRSLVLADKLSEDARVIEPSGAVGGAVSVSSPLVSGDLGVITGFFIVRASSYEEAQRIAAASPHVAHGGRIIIRRIDAT